MYDLNSRSIFEFQKLHPNRISLKYSHSTTRKHHKIAALLRVHALSLLYMMIVHQVLIRMISIEASHSTTPKHSQKY